MFSKFRVNNDEYVVKVSRDIVNLVSDVNRLVFGTFDIKSIS